MEYLPRFVDGVLDQLLPEIPAVMVVGPRAAGKTTTARRVAGHIVHLDRAAEATAFQADPDAALAGLAEPVVLDEWQAVPGVLGAVKRAVDLEPRPGRFVLTGSVRAPLSSEVWPGTGRLVRVRLLPFAQRELVGSTTGPSLLDRLFAGDDVPKVEHPEDLRVYLGLAVRGGFPEPALRLTSATRQAWAASYAEQLVTRDVAALGEDRDRARLRRYLAAVTENMAGVVTDVTLIEAAGINRRTARAYDEILEQLFVLDRVPAWWSNRLKRLTKTEKRYLVDGGLAAAILGVDVDEIMADGDLLGRTIDNFVATQLRAELVTPAHGRLFHLRQQQGRREVDLIVERGRRMVAFEVKATASPTGRDARHLAWLHDELGDRFVAGVVLHTGPRGFMLGDRIHALPIASLWT